MFVGIHVYMNGILYTVYVEADHKCMNQVSADMIMVASVHVRLPEGQSYMAHPSN